RVCSYRVCCRAGNQSLLPEEPLPVPRTHEDQTHRVRLRHEGGKWVVSLRLVGIFGEFCGCVHRDAGWVRGIRAYRTETCSPFDFLSVVFNCAPYHERGLEKNRGILASVRDPVRRLFTQAVARRLSSVPFAFA